VGLKSLTSEKFSLVCSSWDQNAWCEKVCIRLYIVVLNSTLVSVAVACWSAFDQHSFGGVVIQLYIHSHGQRVVCTRSVCSKHLVIRESFCSLCVVSTWLSYGVHTPTCVQYLVVLGPARLKGSLQVARSGLKARALMRFSAGNAPWG
jgi:hypothetical protein